MAKLFGRERLVVSNNIRPASLITVIFNRNYVKPEMNALLESASLELEKSHISISFLDAGFPFIQGFPLLPHLSHSDGKKLDISFIYNDQLGNTSKKTPSLTGYGVFEEPLSVEFNQINDCKSRGFFQYDFSKYLTFGIKNKDLVFSEKKTKILIEQILQNDILKKLFIEPHLKQRLKLKDERVRFHGCNAVRHDDHIHIEIK